MRIILNQEAARTGIILRLTRERESFSTRGDARPIIILNARAQKNGPRRGRQTGADHAGGVTR